MLAACLFFLTSDRKPDLVAALDIRSIDTMFRLRGVTQTTGKVVIVDIDEKSLAALGQWPWSRDVVAKLVDQVRIAGARVIGFDIVFAEEDRTSPSRVLDQIFRVAPQAINTEQFEQIKWNESIDHDLILGRSVSRIPSVLGYIFLVQNDGLKDPTAVPFPSINIRVLPEEIAFNHLNLIPAYRAVINVPAIAQASSEGFFNYLPDATGMVHKVPLFMQMENIPYPSLALEIVRVGEGEQQVTLHASQLGQTERKGLLGIDIGERLIVTDDYGQMTLNFRGPIGTFPYVSAADVIEGKNLVRLQDKYVLFGSTAAGLHDLRATPFSTVFPGVEIQATIIDNLLVGDPMTDDPIAERGLTFILIIVGGILLSALLAYGSPLVGALAGVLFLIGPLVGNYYFYFLNDIIIGLTYPLCVVLAIFLVVTAVNYFFEGREKRFINKAFGHYVSPRVVEQLVKDPKQLTLSGEERVLTVMFSDIRGFTSISEQMNAAQLGRFMNRYLTAMSGVIFESKGTVDKFIGDAIMALWNAPLIDEDHASNSVRCALLMMERFRVLREGLQAEGMPDFGIGVGINTGEVSVGNFGSEERFDYTVIGDHVNLASRLEGLTKLYGVPIIISEFTREALGNRFYCRLLDRVRVKGKDRPVAIYEPLLEGEPEVTLRREIDAFESALQDYFCGDFFAAEKIIAELNSGNPKRLYTMYLKRIVMLQESPPPAEWDGVTSLEIK